MLGSSPDASVPGSTAGTGTSAGAIPGRKIPVTGDGVPPTRVGMGDERPRVRAEGSGSLPSVSADGEELRARRAAEEMTAKQDWGMARAMWHQLACASPPNKYYRAQLGYARAGELLVAGEPDRAREELERVLRLDPEHAAAAAMLNGMKKRGGRISRWFLNR